ncbi:MAG: hypothetical protein AAFO62_04320, partial [Pseudomonadota bacterium]
ADLGPPLPEEHRSKDIVFIEREFFLGLVPPAALVTFALGSILLGYATPTEAATRNMIRTVISSVLISES